MHALQQGCPQFRHQPQAVYTPAVRTTVCLPIYLLDVWVVCTFGLLQTVILLTYLHHLLKVFFPPPCLPYWWAHRKHASFTVCVVYKIWFYKGNWGKQACLCWVPKSYLALCDPMDCCLPGCFVHGISQARILEWFAISSSRGSSPPRIKPTSLLSAALAGRFFTTVPPVQPQNKPVVWTFLLI